MNEFGHLTDYAAEAMSLPSPERISFAREDRWIGYKRALEAIDALSDLLSYPRTLRMPNLLLVGESGNGKSTIAEHFRNLNPVVEKADGNPDCPVLLMEMPSEPSETRFWSELLITLHICHRDSDPVQRKKNQAHSILTFVGCRLLIIDEIHNILYGHAGQQRHFLGVLKGLSNDLKLPIVAVGTQDSIRTLHTDPQLSSRFDAFALPRWKLDADFLRLLASFEKQLPLAYPSNLIGKDLATKLYNLCGGTIGGLTRLLKMATVQAIHDGTERIDLKTLTKINWVKLADYGKQAEAI